MTVAPEEIDLKWYIIHVFSGNEKTIVSIIKEKIHTYNMNDFFGEIIVPTEEVLVVKSGIKKKKDKKFFPGYILIQMHMNNDTWHLIKNIPRILGFIGGNSEKPEHVHEKEVNLILGKMKENDSSSPKIEKIFEVGEEVRVNHGPFLDFDGVIEEIDYEKNRLVVLVSIFGRSTPIELTLNQIDKL